MVLDVLRGGFISYWKCLWKLKIPEKIKFFGWRAVNGSCPTRINLIKKQKVPCELVCPCCYELPGNHFDALWACEQAQQLWSVAGLYRKVYPKGVFGWVAMKGVAWSGMAKFK